MKQNYFCKGVFNCIPTDKIRNVLLLIFISLCSLHFSQAQQRNLKGSKPAKVTYLGTSPKLTKITPIPNRTKANSSDVYIVPNKLTKTGLIKQIPNKTPDPVMQKAVNTNVQMSGAQVKVGFDGGSNQDNANVNGIQVAPPDTQGDVGPDHYIQMTNSVTTIFDKSGTVLFGPAPNSVFFQNLDPVLAGTNDGDPVVLYDQFEDRWIVSQFAVSQGAPYFMLVAVSTTSDPLGTYNQYAINYGEDFPDYPKLGVWNDALYISTRDFPDSGGFGFSLVAINKFDMYNGDETEAQRFQIDNMGADGILPADADGSTPPPPGEPHYSLWLSTSGNSLNLITTTIDFDNPANSSLVFGSIAVAPYAFFNTQVPQPNGQTLDVLPFFLMYRLQYVNFGSYSSMLTNHSVQEEANGPFGIRWYEFRNSGGPWNVHQQGTYLPDDGLNRWMGSVAINEEGDIALGYSVASGDLNPSIRFAGQTASESGSGILNVPETSILEGTLSSNGTNRWGDYSMMSIDPVDQDFWFTTEYIAQDSGFSGWGTFISEMAFGDPPTAICQDITVEFDADDGSVSITPEQIDDGSTGPDGGDVSLSLDIDTFDCSNIGENIVTLTVTSVEGITATCTAVVTVNVNDSEPPVAVCQDILVELNGESVEITAEQVDGGSTDNCAIESFAVDQAVFNEVGTFTVVLTVTDFAGLTDTCEATVTVAQGAQIEVNPTSIEAAVDLQTDIPPVVEDVITVTNNGGVPLEFDVVVGIPDFTPPGEASQALANLDRSIFKSNASISGSLTAAGAKSTRISLTNPKNPAPFNAAVIDSIFYDSGVNFPGDFVGIDNPDIAITTGVRFDVPGDGFDLTAVRNAYRTEAATDVSVLLRVYRGGDFPNEGELLLEQVVTGDSPDGIFAFEKLDTPLNFAAGEHFWVVHSYPSPISFPQGFDDTIETVRPDTYVFSTNGGDSYTFENFASLVRALSEGQDNSFITISPEVGIVAPGESFEVDVTFNGEGLANGTYETDINFNSNDASGPTVTVPTLFTVTGQTSEIEVSEQLLLFNDVFVGNTAERSFIISNIGGGTLNIASITSDNEDFSAEPSSATILAGQQLEVTVTFEPSAVGSSNGVLSIASDADNTPLVDIVLNGVGVEGPFAVLDPALTELSLPATESTNVDIILRNDGESPLTYSFPAFSMAQAIANGAELQRSEVLDFPNFSRNQSKGFTDSRSGEPVRLGMGTDTEFGYTWMDSDEADGPVPFFLDIRPFPDALELTDFLIDGDGFADATVSLDLPYTIPFYGEDYGTIFVNPNGFVAFEQPEGPTFINGQIPVDDDINNIIAPFWADLEPGTGEGGTVHILAFLDAIVVQWTDAPGFNTEGTVTFQLVLFPDGTIDVQYADMSSASFLESATVGIERTGATDGAQVAFNTAYVQDNFAVRFVPPLIPGANFITAVTPLSGVLGAGQQETITVTVDAADLQPGLFLDELVLSSNSVNMDSSTATFELTVTDGPIALLSPNPVQETVLTDDVVQREITIRNDGGGTLEYSFPEFTMAAAIANGAELQRSEIIRFPNFSRDQTKGFIDSRVGNPVRFGMGTDLGFGYTWMDSDEAGGPIPNFIDISGLPFALDLTPDLNDGLFADGTIALNLPYTLPFYGEEFSTIFVNANGFVAYEPPTGLTFLNGQIPVDDGINNIIAPFWADLEPGLADGGTVHAAAFADAVVVQWTNAPGFDTEGDVTFQVIIFLDGTIDVQYESVSSASFLSGATVGIENTGATDGAQVAFNTPYVQDNFAVRFIPPLPEIEFITGISPVSGSLGAGEEETLVVTLDATGLAPEVYLQDLTVSSNSTKVEGSTTTFELTVVDELPSLLTFILVNADTDVPVGPIADGDVINLADYPPGTEFSVEVLTGDLLAESVVFDFNGNTGFRTENFAPYALAGDNSGDFFGVDFPLGINSITATVFSENSAGGDILASEGIAFEVINDLPDASIELILINATTDTAIGVLENNAIIDLANYPEGTEFTVDAVVTGFFEESVVFGLNEVAGFRTENVPPYALAGNAGSDFLSAPFVLGSNTVSATAFSGNGGGGAEGPSISVTFELIDSDNVPGDSLVTFMLINADTNTPLTEIVEGQVIDIAEFGGAGLNIEAEVDLPNVGSVRFGFNGNANFRTENFAPYALGGDSGGNFSAVEFLLGNNTVSADVFQNSGASGAILQSSTINFTIVNGAAFRMLPNPALDRVEITLLEGSGQSLTGTLFNFFGQVVYSNLDFNLKKGEGVSLDVSRLAQGVYILELRNESGSVVSQKKLVKR